MGKAATSAFTRVFDALWRRAHVVAPNKEGVGPALTRLGPPYGTEPLIAWREPQHGCYCRDGTSAGQASPVRFGWLCAKRSSQPESHEKRPFVSGYTICTQGQSSLP